MKKVKRISGMDMRREAPYAKADGNGRWSVDVDAVRARVNAYITKAEEKGQFSLSGLCLALEIPRETLAFWRSGYACEEDAEDAQVSPNEALRHCAEMGVLRVQQYWEESNQSSVQSKYVKMLEDSGALGGKRGNAHFEAFDLGSLDQYGG